MMDNISHSVEKLADKLARRLKDEGYSVEHSKFLVVSKMPIPKNMGLFKRVHYAVASDLPDDIMILPVTLATIRLVDLADCTPELEAEFDEVIVYETHKKLVKYVHNVTQDWITDFSKTPHTASRVSIRLPHLTVAQALEKLAE
jgi:hypothetical protein